MVFSFVNIYNITKEEFEYLCKINKWIDNNIFTKVYVVKENDDVKCVLCLKVVGPNTIMELMAVTKEEERNKGYYAFGFKKVLEEIKKDCSIKGVYIYPHHIATDKLCLELGLKKGYGFSYYFENPNFNIEYDELYYKIISGCSQDELYNFCNNDEKKLLLLNMWNEYKQSIKK